MTAARSRTRWLGASAAFAVVLVVVGGCSDAEPPDAAEKSPDDASATGYLLPKERPADCELATGNFQRYVLPPSYGAVLSPADLDPAEVIDAIQVTVELAKADREVAADEARINEERTVGGRRVRVVKSMKTVAVDWWENGWRVGVNAAERHEKFAIDTAAGVTPPASGGKPEDTDIRVPSGLAMVAEHSARRTSASYVMSTGQCGDRKPEMVTLLVSFMERGADPRVVGLPGRSERRSEGGRDYWVHAERGAIAWTEGPAVASVVTAAMDPELFAHARSLRRVSRDDVERWFAEAKADGQ